jgi:hypothetical protein
MVEKFTKKRKKWQKGEKWGISVPKGINMNFVYRHHIQT